MFFFYHECKLFKKSFTTEFQGKQERRSTNKPISALGKSNYYICLSELFFSNMRSLSSFVRILLVSPVGLYPENCFPTLNYQHIAHFISKSCFYFCHETRAINFISFLKVSLINFFHSWPEKFSIEFVVL